MTTFAVRGSQELWQKRIGVSWEKARTTHNFLKGEAFSLSGEFLPETSDKWGQLFLEPENEKALKRAVDRLNTDGSKAVNRGVLMLGPPGTGKTLSGRIIRNTVKGSFIWISSRDFYYSGAFGGLSRAFELARELSPSVIFVEDVDNWLSDRTTDMMKTEMDGIGRHSGVVTILTTNYPERFPEALIDRPGRFHDVLKFDLPSEGIRSKMLAHWLPELSSVASLKLAKETDGMSGAHLYELAQFAKVIQTEDGVKLDEAAYSALEKVRQQREMINQTQLLGSTYKPRREIAEAFGKGTAMSRTIEMDFYKDTKPKDEPKDDEKPSSEKASCPECGSDLVCPKCGKEEPKEPKKDGKCSCHEKRGRVISQKNEASLRDAHDDVMEIAGMADVPRSAKSLAKSAASAIKNILDQLSGADSDEAGVAELLEKVSEIAKKSEHDALIDIHKALSDCLDSVESEQYRSIGIA